MADATTKDKVVACPTCGKPLGIAVPGHADIVRGPKPDHPNCRFKAIRVGRTFHLIVTDDTKVG